VAAAAAAVGAVAALAAASLTGQAANENRATSPVFSGKKRRLSVPLFVALSLSPFCNVTPDVKNLILFINSQLGSYLASFSRRALVVLPVNARLISSDNAKT